MHFAGVLGGIIEAFPILLSFRSSIGIFLYSREVGKVHLLSGNCSTNVHICNHCLIKAQ